MTPYKATQVLTRQQSKFNKELSKGRQVIKCAFVRMAERFRRLKFLDLPSIESCVEHCIVACTLHNFCLFYNENVFDFTPDDNFLPNDVLIFQNHVNAQVKRNAIAASL